MKRTIDDAMNALKAQVDEWSSGTKASVRVLVYPPEWEAAMLKRFADFSERSSLAGKPIELVDAGVVMLEILEGRLDILDQREQASGTQAILSDLSVLLSRKLTSWLRAPLVPPTVCRLLVNSGAVATVVSFSAITNDAFADAVSPAVIAFPGEGDDTELNLMHLRADTNYRTPRI